MNESERELYELHATLPVFKRRIQKSLAILQEAKKITDRWAVSFSGGKDSTVALDLAYRVFGDKLIVVYQRYGIETYPGNDEMAEWAREFYGLPVHVFEAPGEIDAMQKAGGFFLIPENEEQKKAIRWWWKEAFLKLDERIRELGAGGYILGLRSQESRKREISIAKHGDLFFNKTSRLFECLPIVRWRHNDVWAYIVMRGLKYNPVYDYARNAEERGRIRNELVLLSGTESICRGQLALTRMMFPEYFEKIANVCPELKRFV